MHYSTVVLLCNGTVSCIETYIWYTYLLSQKQLQLKYYFDNIVSGIRLCIRGHLMNLDLHSTYVHFDWDVGSVKRRS